MNCPRCKKPISSTDKVCPHCGVKFVNQAPAPKNPKSSAPGAGANPYAKPQQNAYVKRGPATPAKPAAPAQNRYARPQPGAHTPPVGGANPYSAPGAQQTNAYSAPKGRNTPPVGGANSYSAPGAQQPNAYSASKGRNTPPVKGQSNPYTKPKAPVPNYNNNSETVNLDRPPLAMASGPSKPASKKPWLFIGIGAGVLAIVIILLIVILSPKQTSGDAATYTNSNIPQEQTIENNTQEVAKETRDGSYTIMVYMVGSDLESENRAASADIAEMIASKVDVSNVNIILNCGGAKYWWCSISSENTNILKIAQTQDGLDLAEDKVSSGSQNMGDAASLSGFLNYCHTNYPADHYALICWDHGAGPLLGFGNDEVHEDNLTLDETVKAMENSPFASGEKLDWVGYDACLMGSLEIANVWSKYADYFVGSEEVEPAYGWDYSFLSVLNETFDPVKITTKIVDDYTAFYDNNTSANFNPKITLSAIDLSKIEAVRSQTIKMVTTVGDKIEAGDYSVADTTSGGKVREYGLDSGSRLYLFDLADLADNLSPYMNGESESVKNAVQEAIIANGTNMSSSAGISLFYEVAYAVDEATGTVGQVDAEYSKAVSRINNALKKEAQSKKTDWKMEEVKIGKENATLHLSKEQSESVSRAYYTIITKKDSQDHDYYIPTLEECTIIVDDKGNLKVPLNPEFITAKTVIDGLTVNDAVLTAKQISSSGNEKIYKTVNTRVWDTFEYLPHGTAAEINIKLTQKDGEITVNDVYSVSDSIQVSGRGSIDLSKWDDVGFTTKGYLKSDAFYKDWKDDGFVLFSATGVGSELKFGLSHTEDLNEEVYCQIVIVDKSGNTHNTKCFKLHNKFDANKLEKVKTAKGTLNFTVSEESAQLEFYEGKDKTIEVPETVAGKPVTSIQEFAFGSSLEPNIITKEIVLPDTVREFKSRALSCCEALKKVNIPESVEVIPAHCFYRDRGLKTIELHERIRYIGDFAFAKTGMTKIDFPKDVQHIGKGVALDVVDFSTITIGGEQKGKFYKVENNLLLTENGKELIFGAVDNTKPKFVLPESIEYVDDYALCCFFNEPFPFKSYKANPQEYKTVTELVLPKNLKYIGKFAFAGCCTLKKIDLPESLEYIGVEAFNSFLFQECETLKEIHFGKNVKTIGNEAFGGYKIEKVTVDAENRYYAIKNGKLTNIGKNMEIQIDYKDN